MNAIAAIDVGQTAGFAGQVPVQMESYRSLDALQERFSGLLAQEAPAEHMPQVGDPNVISDFVREQEKLFESLETHAKDFTLNANHQTPQQSAARMVEMIDESCKAHCMIQGAATLTKSVKSNLQTLVKNQ